MAWPEIRQAHRDDYDGDVWTVPAARMKTNSTMRCHSHRPFSHSSESGRKMPRCGPTLT